MSVVNDKPRYIEGVVLSQKVNGLFRAVPPRIALALGLTEKDEKTERQELMSEKNITELAAADFIADKMKEELRKGCADV